MKNPIADYLEKEEKSQAWLAREADCKKQTIHAYINDVSTNITAILMFRIWMATGIRPAVMARYATFKLNNKDEL